MLYQVYGEQWEHQEIGYERHRTDTDRPANPLVITSESQSRRKPGLKDQKDREERVALNRRKSSTGEYYGARPTDVGPRRPDETRKFRSSYGDRHQYISRDYVDPVMEHASSHEPLRLPLPGLRRSCIFSSIKSDVEAERPFAEDKQQVVHKSEEPQDPILNMEFDFPIRRHHNPPARASKSAADKNPPETLSQIFAGPFPPWPPPTFTISRHEAIKPRTSPRTTHVSQMCSCSKFSLWFIDRGLGM